jgi:hypothetical protein
MKHFEVSFFASIAIPVNCCKKGTLRHIRRATFTFAGQRSHSQGNVHIRRATFTFAGQRSHSQRTSYTDRVRVTG